MPTKELEKSPLLQKDAEAIESPEYSDKEELYLRNLRSRMEMAKTTRDQQHDEFDGRDYVTNYELEERVANAYVAPRKNKEDTQYRSGLVRQKIFEILSTFVNLDLRGDVSAYDEHQLKVQGLGDAMEDVMLKTDEMDNDEEKRYLRHHELLKHGSVFVEELWDERQKLEKDNTVFDGKVGDREWKARLKKAFARPTRNVIPGINVFLGDLTKYDITEQPYVFTVTTMPYEEAKLIFGSWDRWTNVSKKLQRANELSSGGVMNADWRLYEARDNFVEIIRYQDKWNNEFAVLLNGVLMTPAGLPLPWGYGEYNIAQQNLEPIHAKFAYGRSLVMRVWMKEALLDEMMRLAVLKTQKSFMPPYLNISGRVVSSRVFMPGKITHGIPPNTLMPINDKESEGVTNAEMAMIKELQGNISEVTTSPALASQTPSSNPTATEIIELQRQAKLVIGLTIFSVTMLEWKLEWLRLQNILKHWFEPEEMVVDEARGKLQEKYRTVTVDRPIEQEGMGKRIVIPTKNPMPSPEAVMKTEDILSKEQGAPVRITFLNPDEIKSAKLCWQIVVRPHEKKTSETEKLLFRAFMQDAMPLQPDIEELRAEFSSVWDKDPKKLFPNPMQMMPEEGGEASGTLSPRVSLPTPEKAMKSKVKNALGVPQ